MLYVAVASGMVRAACSVHVRKILVGAAACMRRAGQGCNRTMMCEKLLSSPSDEVMATVCMCVFYMQAGRHRKEVQELEEVCLEWWLTCLHVHVLFARCSANTCTGGWGLN